MASNKIVVVGSLNIDLVTRVDRMPSRGETISGESFATFPGGKGANQAVCAARLGADVSMIGRLGDDAFGQLLHRDMEQAGVNMQHVQTVSTATGTAVITVDATGGNSIIVIPGANAQLHPRDIEACEDQFRDAALILCQLEVPMESVACAARLARRLDRPFLLDPAPAQPLDRALLQQVTWLTPNESETRSLLRDHGIAEEALRPEDSAAEILKLGVRNVILKLGERGFYIAGADVAATLVPPVTVTAVDTTAAGDAFNGGFAFALAQLSMSPLEAATFANTVAAVSVTRAGAQASMPTYEEVSDFIPVATRQ